LARAFSRIAEPKLKRSIVALVNEIVGADMGGEPAAA
jgi:hypothetical protein